MLQNVQALVKPMEDARRRLLWLIIPGIIGFTLTFIFRNYVINFLLIPAHGHLSATSRPVYNDLTEPLDVAVNISLVGGLIAASPLIAYQLIVFLSSIFRRTVTRRYLALLALSAMFLYTAGVAFAYFVAFPALVHFTLLVGSDIAKPMIHLSDYFSLMSTILLGAGLVFETPLVMYILTKLRIVSYRGLVRFRRYLIVVSFIIGAFFDPSPNPLDQIIIALCLLTLYEIGLLLARMTERTRQSQAVGTPAEV